MLVLRPTGHMTTISKIKSNILTFLLFRPPCLYKFDFIYYQNIISMVDIEKVWKYIRANIKVAWYPKNDIFNPIRPDVWELDWNYIQDQYTSLRSETIICHDNTSNFTFPNCVPPPLWLIGLIHKFSLYFS